MAFTIGFKSVLSYTSTTGEINLGQIKSVSGPNGSATDVDTTVTDTSGNFRTFIRGYVDGGVMDFTIAYDPALDSHKRLGTLYASGAAKTFTSYHGTSTGVAQAFTAYVGSLGKDKPLDDLITCDVSLKVSGDPAFTTT